MFRVTRLTKLSEGVKAEWLRADGTWSPEFKDSESFNDFDKAHAKAKDLDANVWSPPRPKKKP